MIHQIFLDTPPRKSEWEKYIGEVETVLPVGTTVKKKDILLEFDFVGQMSLGVNSPRRGVIISVHVKVGQTIKSKDLLMEIDDGLNP